jgi:hypothetical protein
MIESTSGSMKKEKIPPHPLTPGATNELFTNLPPLTVRIVNAGLNANDPAAPLSAPSVPVVKLICTGLEFDPM